MMRACRIESGSIRHKVDEHGSDSVGVGGKHVLHCIEVPLRDFDDGVLQRRGHPLGRQ